MAKTTLNNNLHKAHRAKKDEFYTQLIDIQKELKYYKDQFKGKVVYCNCDDPFESNFFKHFALNFQKLGLKRLIATSYKPSPIANTELILQPSLLPEYEDKVVRKPTEPKGRPKTTANKFIINDVGDLDGDGAFDLQDIAIQLKSNKNNEWSPLEGDGDFRSEESIELLKQADIVVTNPPFSLFREYVGQLIEHDKKFLILGSQGAVIYKEISSLIKENRLWLGYDNGGTKWFQVPDDYDIPTESRKKKVDGVKYFSMGSVNWFTNLDVARRNKDLVLYKKYNEKEYSKYDNYDGINVNRYIDIPMDYDGVMGVPITFLNYHNPDQFEIIGLDRYTGKNGDKDFTINGKMLFRRLLIKNKKPQK